MLREKAVHSIAALAVLGGLLIPAAAAQAATTPHTAAQSGRSCGKVYAGKSSLQVCRNWWPNNSGAYDGDWGTEVHGPDTPVVKILMRYDGNSSTAVEVGWSGVFYNKRSVTHQICHPRGDCTEWF